MARMITTVNTLTSPAWAGDIFDREHLLPGGAKVDPTQFNVTDAVPVILTSSASAAATSLAVSALIGSIPSGTVLDFTGTNKFAQLTSAAAAGATSLAVAALPEALTSGDTALYAGTSTARKTVVSGTPVGRTFTERAAGTAFGPAVASDDEVYLVAFDVYDADLNNDVELYRYGGIVKENLLPGFTNIVSGVLTKIRANYQTTRGAN